MMKHFLHNILLFAGSLLTVVLAGCGEDENTYEYRLVNQTAKEVCIRYVLFDSPKIEYDTLMPGEDVLIYVRENVTGDGIWDIESGSMMFVVDSLKASVNDSVFTENLCARKYWQGPQEEEGIGLYCMTVDDSLFVLCNQKYHYELNNKTSKNLSFILYCKNGAKSDTLSVLAGESLLLGCQSVEARYLVDLHGNKDKNGNIGFVSISELKMMADTGMVIVNNYNANAIDNWTFSRDLLENDSIGRYVLNMEECVFDNMQE